MMDVYTPLCIACPVYRSRQLFITHYQKIFFGLTFHHLSWKIGGYWLTGLGPGTHSPFNLVHILRSPFDSLLITHSSSQHSKSILRASGIVGHSIIASLGQILTLNREQNFIKEETHFVKIYESPVRES